MTHEHEGVRTVRAALERRPEVNMHRYPITLRMDGGTLVLEGEVEDIAAKRIARREASRVFGISGVRDALRVVPAERRGDGEIADDLERALKEELAFRDYLTTALPGRPVPPHETEEIRHEGVINATVQDGVITLEGSVESLTHKRLAEVLAWWTRGAVRVVDRLRVLPQERDTDEEVTDALEMVLEKDPSLDAGRIAVEVRDHKVTLRGVVSGEDQRRVALRDAWSLAGVADVDNRLEVQAGAG